MSYEIRDSFLRSFIDFDILSIKKLDFLTSCKMEYKAVVYFVSSQ